jgi:hypothetical protein
MCTGLSDCAAEACAATGHMVPEVSESSAVGRHSVISKIASHCSSAEKFGSARYQKCHALTNSIDALAKELTGDLI